MKVIPTIVLIALVSLTVSASIESETESFRNLITSFFQTVRGSTWSLPDECLGKNIDTEIEKIKQAIESLDFVTALTLLKTLKKDLADSCPIEELVSLEKEVETAVKSGAIYKNIAKNLFDLIKLVRETQEITDEKQVGVFLGKVYKLVVVGTTHNLKFLADVGRELSFDAYAPMGSSRVEEFINGFIQGTSDVALEKNQCIIGTKAFLPALAAAVEQLITAFREMKNLKEAFINFMNTAMKLKDVESNCHFISLATTFLTITNPVTIAKIGWRITTNILKFVSLVKDAVTQLKAGNFRGCGASVGAIFQITFEYHTQ